MIFAINTIHENTSFFFFISGSKATKKEPEYGSLTLFILLTLSG